MLDLSIQERVPTPDSIPALLDIKGWHPGQVAGVWRPSTSSSQVSQWNEQSVEALGGKGVLSKVWLQLKDSSMTGFQKRQAATEISGGSAKRMKPDTSTNKGTLVKLVSPGSQGTHTVVSSNGCQPLKNPENSPTFPRNLSPKQTPARKKKRAHRKGLLATPKITEWLQVTPIPKKAAAPEEIAPQQRRRRARSSKKILQLPLSPSSNLASDHLNMITQKIYISLPSC